MYAHYILNRIAERHWVGEIDLRLLCDCGHVPESRVESVADSCSGDRCTEVGGKPLVRVLIDGSPS